MAALDFLEDHRHFPARRILGFHELAPWCERAAGSQAREIWGLSADGHQLPVGSLGGELRERVQERDRVRVPRAGEERRGACLLHHVPRVHHRHAVARLRDHAEVVRDEETAIPLSCWISSRSARI